MSASVKNGVGNVDDTYSTTEQVIGTWIDGKPIYRKVITGSDVYSDIVIDSSLTASTISNLINIGGSIWITNSEWIWPFFYDGSYSHAYIVIGNAGTYISVNGVTVNKFVAILEYTKTTD